MTRKPGPTAVALALATLALAAAPPALAGSITIVTVSVPKDAQDFSYPFGAYNVPKLDDDAGAVGGDNALPNSYTINNLGSGYYDLMEYPAAPGWALTSIICTGGAGDTPNLATRRTKLGLTIASKAVCTFTHQKVGP